MQNSLERLFDGIATSLRENVAPVVEDPYAKAQVAATIELLANLAVRVEWRADLLLEEIERIRAVLETAPERARRARRARPARQRRSRSPRAPRTSTRSPPPIPTRTRCARFSTWQLERELGLLRTGMYK